MSLLHLPREEVLAQCEAAERHWERQPGRNLVLLFDGTGNILGSQIDTNVVKLLRLLHKDPLDAPAGQVVHYDPGVGTASDFPAPNLLDQLRSHWRRFRGLAEGEGVFQNIAEAYEFLCREHRPADRIFLLGFSRGAFTARAVGGMVNMYGLVGANALPLLSTLVRNYFAPDGPDRERFLREVRQEFTLGRLPLVHFTGVWDTVEKIGAGGLRISNGKDVATKRFAHVRHAMSMHETRLSYHPREYDPPEPAYDAREAACRSFRQLWFRGVHSDVGGSYARAGLSDVALDWMVDEARACGLRVAPSPWPGDPATAMHDAALDAPFWVWAGLQARVRPASPDVLHPSAAPVQGATPAQRSNGAWPFEGAGIVLFMAAAWFGMAAWIKDRAVCATHPALDWLPTKAQLLGYWAAPLGLQCDAGKLQAALAWDWAFLVAYTLWLAYPVAWATRLWARHAIDANRRLPWLYANAHHFMWLLVGADVLENLCSLQWESQGWRVAIAVFCAAKLLATLCLLAVGAGGVALRLFHATGHTQLMR